MFTTELLTALILVLALAGFVVMAFVFYWLPYKDSNGEYLAVHRKPLAPSDITLKDEKCPYEWDIPPE